MLWGIALALVNVLVGLYFEKPEKWKPVTRVLATLFWLPLLLVAITLIVARKGKKKVRNDKTVTV